MGGTRTKKGSKGRRGVQHHKSAGKSAFLTDEEKRELKISKAKKKVVNIDETLTKSISGMRKIYREITADPAAADRMSDSEIEFNLRGMKSILDAGRTLADDKFSTQMMEDMYGMFIENDNEKMKQFMYLQGGLQLIELKDTGDIGMGVYATTDIPKGEVAGFYPVHYMALVEDGKEHWACPPDSGHTSESLQKYIDGEGRAYSMKCVSHKFIGDPKIVEDWWALGHMINDRAYDGTEDYDPMARCNVIFDANFILTTRDIKKGDELSVCYGSPYWFQGWNTAVGETWHDICIKNKM